MIVKIPKHFSRYAMFLYILSFKKEAEDDLKMWLLVFILDY